MITLPKHEEVQLVDTSDSSTPTPPLVDDRLPTFEEVEHASSSGETRPLIEFTETIPGQGGEEPPPQFTPYEAEFTQDGNGDIISHDPHLNTDGEALYRFLLSQTSANPVFYIHCHGQHSESRTRWVRTTDNQGREHTRSENYTEVITDFDFLIDIGQNIVGTPVIWSVADSEPAYRGAMVREVEGPEGKRRARREEKKSFKAWVEQRSLRGYPPWIGSVNAQMEGTTDETNVLKSSKSLREWADEYCASEKHLKEFVYKKVVYGWNLQQLESAVRHIIVSSLYQGIVNVEFNTRSSKVYIRPDNTLSRLLSNKWLKFLSIILLIYPFIWLFKRFNSRGGGSWEVCGSAHALKRWVPCPQDELDRSPDPSRFLLTPDGMRRSVGMRETEWCRLWAPTISRAVVTRYQASQPLYDPIADVGIGLGGRAYNDGLFLNSNVRELTGY